MPTGDPALIELIRKSICSRGPVSFAWFMEQALYHPELGYYSSGRCAIGRRGDYFTNVSVGPLFGKLLAAQFAEMWEALGRPTDFVLELDIIFHEGDAWSKWILAIRSLAVNALCTAFRVSCCKGA